MRLLSDRTSLRTKLISVVLVLVVMALAAISIASVVVLRSYLYTQHDDTLRDTSRLITTSGLNNVDPNVAMTGRLPPGMIVAVQLPGSQLVPDTSGPAAPGFGRTRPQQSLPKLPASRNWASSRGGVLVSVPAQAGSDTWRVLAQNITLSIFPTQTQQPAILVVAIDLGPVGAEIHRLIAIELIVGLAIVIVLAVVAVAMIRANLRPLNDIELTAGQIARGHLNHRVPERDPRTEIGSLGQSLNAMLTQIESAFNAQEESEQAAHESEERMRRFIADASHELRTPLTTIRGFAEYYRQRGGVRKNQIRSSGTERGISPPANGHSPDGLSPEDLDRIMKRLEAEASRMGLLVEDLLELARLDQQRPLDVAPVDLLTLAADAVQDARMVAPDRPIDLSVAPGAAFIVDGDERRLRQVIANLVNNALTHTPAGTAVRVRIASGTLVPPPEGRPGSGPWTADGAVTAGWSGDPERPGRPGRPGGPVPAVLLDVEDDGRGMTTEQAQHVFERFYRADQARNRASGGTGLGLAIVAGLVAAHGGTVSVRTAPGKGADFQVKLPLSPDAHAAEEDEDEPSDPGSEEHTPDELHAAFGNRASEDDAGS
jgi:two-component system OmpR family sensor kinase